MYDWTWLAAYFVAGCIVASLFWFRVIKSFARYAGRRHGEDQYAAYKAGFKRAGEHVSDLAQVLRDKDREDAAMLVTAVADNLNRAAEKLNEEEEVCKKT